MTNCGTTTYTDPDDYRANVPGAVVSLVLTSGNAFKTRVAWIKLRRLTLVGGAPSEAGRFGSNPHRASHKGQSHVLQATTGRRRAKRRASSS